MKQKMFLLALAGVAFAACSNHDDYSLEKYAESKHQAKIAEYTAAFKHEFGTPAFGHQWGFGSGMNKVKTRTADTNGKFWIQNGYDNIPPADTKKYEAEVTEIFRDEAKWKKYQVTGIDFSDFFVQQVHKGTTGDCTYTSYKDNNGSTSKIYGPEQMEQLVCQKSGSDPEHVNNFNFAEFNHGNWNQEVWNGEGGEFGFNDSQNLYQDAIILMTNSGTNAFGWSNSNESGVYYMDAFIVIEYPENSGYYYVGFDYYRKNDGVKSDSYNNKLKEIAEKQENYNNYSSGWSDDQKAQALAEIERLKKEAEQYADYYKNGDKFVDRDYRYDDWIIRVTPAKKQKVEETAELFQVWCEDLGGEYGKNGNDFDFNDVVLSFRANGGNTEIWLLAAGGTLELTVAWDTEEAKEVHNVFGVPTGTMVNTGRQSVSEKLLWTVPGIVAPEDLGKLKIQVKDAETAVWYTLENSSDAPQMIVCEPNMSWPDERVNINTAYNDDAFNNWVQNAPTKRFSGKKK